VRDFFHRNRGEEEIQKVLELLRQGKRAIVLRRTTAGRPVEVWIIGSVYNGIPVVYTPPDGLETVVARYEHTVVVVGYSQNRVYFLNGDTVYSKQIYEFLDSWSALGNMAITASP